MVVVMVRGELKCAIRECGQLWMDTTGIIMMLVCCVVNWDMMISVRIINKDYRSKFYIDTQHTIQGLLPLEMLNMAIKGWCTNTTVMVMKCPFSHVQIVYTQIL